MFKITKNLAGNILFPRLHVILAYQINTEMEKEIEMPIAYC